MHPGLNERQQQIMEMLSREGEVRIRDLKEHFSVTEMTLRRDLEKMEQIGVLKRTFGGAISVTQDVRKRSVKMIEEKIRIGKKAAESVQPGESVFIDGGTTTLQVAKHLPTGIRITVVTNALNVANVLLEKGIRTIVTGGIALETTSTLVGPLAVEAISRMAFDRAFIGATGQGDVPTGSIEYKTIFAVGLTLFVITFVMNVISIRLVRKYREVYE